MLLLFSPIFVADIKNKIDTVENKIIKSQYYEEKFDYNFDYASKVCKQTRVLNGKSNIYYDKDKIKLSCYMLLEVSYVRNHQAYIMFILPKKIKQNSH